MSEKKTCGPMYLEAALKWSSGSGPTYEAFAAGFVNGQAEKVYLGACHAAMFRRSPEHQELVCELVEDACNRYGLKWTAQIPEFWICRDEAVVKQVLMMYQTVPNSPAWHAIRAVLCGIPPKEVDFNFHERKGHGERCDPSAC